MPTDDITQTGPLTASELQALNDTPFLSKKERKDWFKTLKSKDLFNDKIEDGIFISQALERSFRNNKFKEKFGKLDGYVDWATSLSEDERDAIYRKYATAADYIAATTGQPAVDDSSMSQIYNDEDTYNDILNRVKMLANNPYANLSPFIDFNNETLDEETIKEYKKEQARKKRLAKNIAEGYKRNDNNLNPEDIDIKNYTGLQMSPQDFYNATKISVESHNIIEESEAKKQERLNIWADEYKRDHPMPTNIAGMDEYDGEFASTGWEAAAKKYAQIKEKEFLETVPEDENPYRGIATANDLKKRLAEMSSSYNRYKGSTILNESDINYDELLKLVTPLIKQNRPTAVENVANKYVESKVKQSWWTSAMLADGTKEHGKWRTALGEMGGNFVEGFWEYEPLTNIAAWCSGFITAAVNPDEWQLDAGMNYMEMVADKARHARLGFIGPGAGKDLGDAIRTEDQIVGEDVLSVVGRSVIPLTGYLSAFALGGAEDLLLTGGMGTSAKMTEKATAKAALKASMKKELGVDVPNDVIERYAQLLERKYALIHNKGIQGAMTVHAASAEALGEAAQVEDDIMRKANSQIEALEQSYYDDAYNNPGKYPYKEEDFNEAYKEIINKYISEYGSIEALAAKNCQEFAKNNPDVPLNMEELYRNEVHRLEAEIIKMAEASASTKLAAAEQSETINRAYRAQAHRMGNMTWLTETVELAFMEGYFGGATSRLLPFRKVKNLGKASSMSPMISFKDGKFAVNLPTGKQTLNAVTENITNVASEVIQEGPMQGFTSSYATFKGTHSAEEFVNNHFFGDGSLAMDYYTSKNPSLQELVDDSHLGDVMLETAVGTALTGAFSPRRLFRKSEKRREGESKFRYAVKQVLDYLPFDTPITQSISDIMHTNDEAYDIVNWLNNYYSMPQNQAKLKGTRAFTSYAINMQKDILSGDEVSYDNDKFSLTLAEAIMLSRIADTPMYKARMQQLQNMASIKSSTDEQKQEAIKDWREHTTTADMAKLTDDEILDAIEDNGNRVLELFDKVKKQNETLDRTYGTNLSYESRAMMLFGMFASENLQERVKDKQNYINGMIALIAEEDLGESRDADKINWGDRASYKNIQLSGHDIMRLSNIKRLTMLNPKNRHLFSDEQQIIIQKTIDALKAVDPDMNIEQDIRDIATMEANAQTIKNEYKKTLQNVNKPSEKFERKRKEKLDTINNKIDKRAREFQERILNAKSVQELKRIYEQEAYNNERRSSKKQFDIDKALNDIKNPEVKKKVEELNKIRQAANSIKAELSVTGLPAEVKESLAEQVDGLANTKNSANELYSLDNYTFDIIKVGDTFYVVSDNEAGEFSDALEKAKKEADGAQAVYSENNDTAETNKGTEFGEASDLSDRDVDTAPPVNNGPIEKLTLEDANKLIAQINELLAKNDITGIIPLINKIRTQCPEGYQYVREGHKAYLKKIENVKPEEDTEIVIDEELGDGPAFIPEDYIIIDEELEDSFDTYPDTDVRSVTKIAIIRFDPDGPEYAYPVRDEDVRMEDTVQGNYGKQGRIERFETPEEYSAKHSTGEYTLEAITQYPRAQFIDNHTSKNIQSSNTTNAPTSNIIYEDTRVINTVETSEKDDLTIYKVKSYRKDKQKYSTRGMTPISEDLLTDESKEQLNQFDSGDVRMIDIFAEEVRESGDTVVCETIVKVYHYDGSVETINQTYKLTQNPLKNSQSTKAVEINSNQNVDNIQPPTPPTPPSVLPTSNRTQAQQERLNNNVTPARNEISPQHVKDMSMTRLGDANHSSIDSQLESNGAFEYVDSGMLGQDDELVFVVTEEEMPDDKKTPVIWIVTKNKTENLPTDGKFLGYQVLNVLDQTSMSGERGKLISRIRTAYEKAGKPSSFLYNTEPIKVKSIVKGFIPAKQTNPTEAQSQETISSTNLQKGLTKSNGRWGIKFKSSKTGKLIHVPVIFRQSRRSAGGNVVTSISHGRVNSVETVKNNPLTQDESNEVMLVVPTPTGWQAAHSVYVLKRYIQGAIDKYKDAINNGELGKRLITKAITRLTDPKAVTAFSDFFRFNRGISERVIFDPNHNRLELGIRGNFDTTFVYALKRGDFWVITEADARNVIDDNEGKGFTIEEVIKRYLNALMDSEEAGASLQINMSAISKDNSLIDALIDDGFLWAPNSYPGRLTMENVGFEAPIGNNSNNSNNIAEAKVENVNTNTEVKAEPAPAAPKPSNPVIEEPVTTNKKVEVPDSIDDNDVGAVVPRRKKKSGSGKKIDITPTTPLVEERFEEGPSLATELKEEAKKPYNELSEETKAHLEEKGISQENWDMYPGIRENVLNC